MFLRQGGLRFSTIKFLCHQLAILFVKELAKREKNVLPVNENNTFLKVNYAVGIYLKFDYAFNLVLLSARDRRSKSGLDPIV